LLKPKGNHRLFSPPSIHGTSSSVVFFIKQS
jgi:hypothetical protein